MYFITFIKLTDRHHRRCYTLLSLLCVPLIMGDLIILCGPMGLFPEGLSSLLSPFLCSCLDVGKQWVMFNGITKGLSIALGR